MIRISCDLCPVACDRHILSSDNKYLRIARFSRCVSFRSVNDTLQLQWRVVALFMISVCSSRFILYFLSTSPFVSCLFFSLYKAIWQKRHTYLIHILRNDDDESTGYIWWCCVYVCSHDGRCWLVLWSPDQIRRSVIWITFNFFFSFFAFSQLTDNYIYLLLFLHV